MLPRETLVTKGFGPVHTYYVTESNGGGYLTTAEADRVVTYVEENLCNGHLGEVYMFLVNKMGHRIVVRGPDGKALLLEPSDLDPGLCPGSVVLSKDGHLAGGYSPVIPLGGRIASFDGENYPIITDIRCNRDGDAQAIYDLHNPTVFSYISQIDCLAVAEETAGPNGYSHLRIFARDGGVGISKYLRDEEIPEVIDEYFWILPTKVRV